MKSLAGVAYEHELDGKASGTADGMAIRGTDTSGGSLRGEIGANMKLGEDSPITLNFYIIRGYGRSGSCTSG